MNQKQATRPIRKGAHWMNSEEEVVITKSNSRSVYYKVIKPREAVGFSEIWHFRENYCPGRLPTDRMGLTEN
jgi:hypothetical protein